MAPTHKASSDDLIHPAKMTCDKAIQAPNNNEARKAQAEAAILGAARRLFIDLGFSRTSMDAVSSAARCSKQTLYRQFPTKEELFVGVLWNEIQGLMEFKDTGTTEGDLQSLAVELQRSATMMRPLGVSVVAEADHGDRLRELLQRTLDRWLGQVSAVFERGIERGDLDPGMDIELLALLATGLFSFLAENNIETPGDLASRLAAFMFRACGRSNPDGSNRAVGSSTFWI
jgi:AcrR family transcriptional regulator